jgi:AraC-like DNA-binding protein
MVVARPGGIHITRSHGVFDLLFVCRGVLAVQEEERAFDVQAGQALLLWPDRHHHGTREYPPDLRYFWIHFTLIPGTRPDISSLLVPQYSTVARPSYLTELLLRYIGDRETKRSSPFSDSLLILLMLRELATSTESPETMESSVSLAGRAYSYIRTNYRQPLTPSQIAAYLGCNPQYLSRIFHRAYHQTLMDTIHQTRMEYARILLVHSELNITEIAHACGFSDARYFYRVFRRLQGMTALAFRDLYSRNFINAE